MISPDLYDNTYLNMQLALPKKGEPEPQFSLITKLLRDANVISTIKASDDPILDTRMYEVEYAYGKTSAFFTNLIAEKMSAQIYKEVNRHVLMGQITDHRFDEAAVKIQDTFVYPKGSLHC